MKNLFVRGPIRIGKSTHIRNFINANTSNIIGMCGQRIIENQTDIVGYQAKFINLEPLPDVNVPDKNGLENIFIYKGKIDELVLEKTIMDIDEALSNNKPDIIILDETGGFELKNPNIMKSLSTILSYNIPCVGTIKAYNHSAANNATFSKDYFEEYQAFSKLIENDGKILDVTQDTLDEIDMNLDILFKKYNLFER